MNQAGHSVSSSSFADVSLVDVYYKTHLQLHIFSVVVVVVKASKVLVCSTPVKCSIFKMTKKTELLLIT